MNDTRQWMSGDAALATAIMALMGAFYWAIRGTSGYGGEMGGMLAGFGWALLWYAFSQMGGIGERRPYGHPWVIAAIMLGIAFGGFTGYGVYISWLNGRFHLNHPDGLRAVPAWTGYAMLFACGWHWGGNTGCFLAWCAPQRPLRGRDWAVRLACGVIGAIAAGVFVRVFPQLFLPFYSEGIYSVLEYKTCQRALDSIRNIAPHVGLCLGFLAYEIARGDRRAVGVILTLALGFAIPFTVGGYWQTFHGSAVKIDWWKNWEMSIGFGGGLSLGLAFWWFNRAGDTVREALGPKSRAFFQSGLAWWLPVATILLGVYDGLCELHEIERTPAGYAAVLALSLTPVLAAWFRRRRGVATDPYRLSFPAIAAFQALILAAGLLVSIPQEWRLANAVLITLYTCYISASLILFILLWQRQN